MTASDHTSPHWDRAALVRIDAQNDFVDGAAPIPGTAEVLPELAHLLGASRSTPTCC